MRRRQALQLAAAPFVWSAAKGTPKTPVMGSGEHTYEAIHDWPRLPSRIKFGKTHGIVIDSRGRVIVAHTVHASSESPDAIAAAKALLPYELMWFEDICDPLDFETQSAVTGIYDEPIAAGEALFSAAEAKLLDRHGGLHRDRDILLFDPVHCYGLPGYLQIVEVMEARGWKRSAFWPHGGHLFSLHLASALGLGGAEVNPSSFRPFGGLVDGAVLSEGRAVPPELPGIGFEGIEALDRLFRSL